MGDSSRRTALQGTAVAIVESALAGRVPAANADKHEPPTAGIEYK